MVLTRSLDRETVLVTLLDRLRRMVPFDRASVMLLEEASRVSVRAVFDGDRVVPLPAEERPEFEPTDHPIVHGILTTGTAVLIPDVRAHPDWSLPTGPLVRGELDGGPAVRPRRRGRVVLAVQARGRLLQRGARQAGRGDVVPGLGRRRERGSLRADAGVDRCGCRRSRAASSRRRRASGAASPASSTTRRARPWRRCASGSACWSGRSTRAAASPDGWRSSCRRTDAVIDGLHRLAADLRPASLDHLGLEAALRQYSRSAGGQVRPRGPLQGARVHRASVSRRWWRRRSTAWSRRR